VPSRGEFMKVLILGLVLLSSTVKALEVNSNTFEIVVSGEQKISCDEWGIRQDGPYYYAGLFNVTYFLKLKTCMKTSVESTAVKMKIYSDGQELGYWTISSNSVYESTIKQLGAFFKMSTAVKKKIYINEERLMEIPHQYLSSSWKKILSLSVNRNENDEDGEAKIRYEISQENLFRNETPSDVDFSISETYRIK
jgi:hypothetical protein